LASLFEVPSQAVPPFPFRPKRPSVPDMFELPNQSQGIHKERLPALKPTKFVEQENGAPPANAEQIFDHGPVDHGRG